MKTNGHVSEHRSVGDVNTLWMEYKRSGSEMLRGWLIEHYMDLVRDLAMRMHQKLPQSVDIDDMVSDGIFGLMSAIDAFDPGRGVKFETFCVQRIRGAIFDALREADWVPRLTRARAKKLDRARVKFRTRYGFEPTDDELREFAGLAPEHFEKLRNDSGSPQTVSISRARFHTDSNKEVREIDCITDSRLLDPSQDTDRSDLRKAIFAGLDRTSRLAMRLHFLEGYTMAEVGQLLYKSESRISQIISLAIDQMRSKLKLARLAETDD